MSGEKETMTTAQAAEHLGVGINQVYELLYADNGISGVKDGRNWVIDAASVKAFKETGRPASPFRSAERAAVQYIAGLAEQIDIECHRADAADVRADALMYVVRELEGMMAAHVDNMTSSLTSIRSVIAKHEKKAE